MWDEPESLEEVLERALDSFYQHPARALSARELAILMDEDVGEAEMLIEELENAGYIEETNAVDGEYVRYKIVREIVWND